MALTSFLRGLGSRVRGIIPAIGAAARKALPIQSVTEKIRNIFGKTAPVSPAAIQDVYRKQAEIARKSANLKYIRRDRRPDGRKLPVAITDIVTRYSYTVRLWETDPKTGVRTPRWVTVVTDDELTRGEIEDSAMSAVLEDPASYGQNVGSPLLTEGVQSPRWAR